jgi:hypothetical protein
MNGDLDRLMVIANELSQLRICQRQYVNERALLLSASLKKCTAKELGRQLGVSASRVYRMIGQANSRHDAS